MSRGPRLLQGCEHRLRRLRAGQAVRAVEHEKRDSRDPELARLELVMAHIGGVRVAVEHLANRRLVEAGLDGEPGEGLLFPDGRSLDEIGRHQTLLERVLLAGRLCVVDEAVRIKRIAGARAIQVEVQADGGGIGGDPRLRGLGGRTAHAVLGGQPLDGITLRRLGSAWVELEAAPRDVDLAAMIELGQCVLEPALADVAPGTDDVRPDLNIHGLVCTAWCLV